MRFKQSLTKQLLPGIIWAAVAAVPVLFVAIFFGWPVVSLIMRGLADPQTALEIALSSDTVKVLGQTLMQATAGTVVSVLAGIPVGYALYRVNFRGVTALRALITVPFVMPTVVVAVSFNSLYGESGALYWLGLDQSFTLLVMAFAFFNITVVARSVGTLWERLDTRPADAARMLGAGPVRVFLTITLPALRPAIAAASALVFLFCATSFGIVLILGGRRFANLETAIYRNTVQLLDLQTAAVLAILQTILVVLSLVVAQRIRSRSEQRQLVQKPAARLGRSNWLPVAVTILIMLLQAMPLFSLLWRSLHRDGRFTLQNYADLAVTHKTLNGSVLDAAFTSLKFAVIATLLTVVISAIAAIVASRRPTSPLLRRGLSLFDGLLMLPVGVSAVTLGSGLLLTMHRPFGIDIDLRTDTALIFIAQALVAMPIVMRILLPSLRAIDQRSKDAAAVLGASPLRVMLDIELPQLGRALGIALGFAFAAALGEFGASSFLVRPGATTLPVIISYLAAKPGSSEYGSALAAAVLLGAITAAVMLAAERIRPKQRGEW
ncbi:iron ABC transporter permease [Leucobacter sp. OH1287]|uniref:ABC transporter permease n=1 Tax=Leucobacter sp. OH1287 TaxID=2491049 RepID=UPI000F5D5F94|nr:iron ABC transporter permease [Leucobacter sp. OH1287]RRD61579.1 iron ABC transporter permease [Leucobacter sp. OH1287]